MFNSGKINYTILDDGTCSYCGNQSELIEWDDGTLEWSRCFACDEYNEELEIDIQLERMAWLMEKEGEEFLQDN